MHKPCFVNISSHLPSSSFLQYSKPDKENQILATMNITFFSLCGYSGLEKKNANNEL
jgi:hypothetical protein